MERTEMKMSSSKWRKHLGAMTFFVALFFAVFTVESVHAQGWVTNSVPYALSQKANNGQGVNFIPATEVAQVLKPAIENLVAESPSWNGNNAEATGGLRIAFYSDIVETVSEGETVEDAVLDAYRRLVGAAAKVNATVNTDALLQDAIDLISI